LQITFLAKEKGLEGLEINEPRITLAEYEGRETEKPEAESIFSDHFSESETEAILETGSTEISTNQEDDFGSEIYSPFERLLELTEEYPDHKISQLIEITLLKTENLLNDGRLDETTIDN